MRHANRALRQKHQPADNYFPLSRRASAGHKRERFELSRSFVEGTINLFSYSSRLDGHDHWSKKVITMRRSVLWAALLSAVTSFAVVDVSVAAEGVKAKHASALFVARFT